MSQEQRIADTFGDKIGGSRRDIRRMFDAGDYSLEGLDEKDLREARRLATKERMWPEPDWASLDADPRRSIRVRMLRAALPAKCPTVISFEEYVKLVRNTKEKCEAYMVPREAKLAGSVIDDWNDDNITEYRTIRFLSTVNRKEILSIMNESRAGYFDALVEAAGWPARTDSLLLDGYIPRRVLGPNRDLAWSVGKNGRCVSKRTFTTTEETIAYINGDFAKELESFKPSRKPKRIDPVRPMLQGIMRSGPDWGVSDISPEMFQETFGFRGGEFGTWLTQEDRRQSLRYAYDAFMDLAKILDIDPKEIGGDKLGFAFGARGVGKASAHFEPDLTVINLTKMNGAGATAHEWGHFIDHTRYPGSFTASERMDWLKAVESTPEEREALFEARIKELIKVLGSWVRGADCDSMKNMDLLVSTDDPRSELFEIRYKAVVHGAVPAKKRNAFIYALDSAKNPHYGSRHEPQFAKDATTLDQGRSKSYWSTNVELFARIFEKYVDMRMREEGMENNYLVSLLEHPSISVYPSDVEMELYRPRVEEFLDERFPSRQKQEVRQAPVQGA